MQPTCRFLDALENFLHSQSNLSSRLQMLAFLRASLYTKEGNIILRHLCWIFSSFCLRKLGSDVLHTGHAYSVEGLIIVLVIIGE